MRVLICTARSSEEEKNMKVLVRLFVIAALVAALGTLAYAAQVQGILLDRMCATKIVAAKDQKAAQGHTRECALMPGCLTGC
jgi:hypothetical protein